MIEIGSRVLVDGKTPALIRSAWPNGSSSFAFPHYRLDLLSNGEGPLRPLLTHSPPDRNVAVAANRVSGPASPGAPA